MIPILYEANETEFMTNGLGRLADAASCTVTEERNGQYELEMEYPITGIHYQEISEERIILALPSEGAQTQPFRIYRITKPLDGTVTVCAQHISYALKKMVVLPFFAASAVGAMSGIGDHIIGDCPFTFWTDKATEAKLSQDVPVECRSLLGGVSGSVLDVFGGGDYEFDRFAVKLHQNRGADNGVTIRYGKNLTGMESEADYSGTYTSIVPYWKGQDEAGGEVFVAGDKVASEHEGDFAYQKCVTMDFSGRFDTPPTKQQLEDAAKKYMQNNATWEPHVNTDVSFIPLWQTEEYADVATLERVKLCDTVTVVYEDLGVSIKAKVITTVFDVLQERYTSIELGDGHATLAETVNKDTVSKSELKENLSWMEQAVDDATKRIVGGLGGHVVIKPNADGKPEEILIMDTEDIKTAQKVWRWNMGGLGYSENGYDGPFGTAITMDGEIVADWIKTGTLMAGLIKAGRISDMQGQSYWDMDTGEMNLKVNSFSLANGDTIDSIAQKKVDGQTQEDIFNKLTGNGERKGIFLRDGELYINMSYLQTGALRIVKDGQTIFLADGDNKRVEIVADEFSLSDGSTIGSIAQDAVDGQTQEDIFNKLTENGERKGIFLLDGELYISASYLTTGILQSKDGETFYLDLDNGVLKMKATQLEIAGQSVNDALADAVTGMKQEYYLSSSATYLYGGDWSTAQPAWTQGWYIWNRQHVTYGNGTEAYLPSEDGVCITGNTGEDGTSGENGVGVTSIEAQYYSYSSYTYPPSSYYAWSTNMPAVQDGYYIWCRQKVSYDDGSTTYTDPYCMSKTMGDIAQAKVDAQTQEQIFDKLTNGGEIKGIYMEDGQLYISFTYAKGGELVLGGSGNYRGQLKILDENGNLAGLISNAVFAQYAENGNKAVEIRNNGVRYYAYDSGGAYVGGSAASASRGSGQKGVSHWVEAGGKLTLGYRLSDGGIKSKLWIDSSDASKTVQMDGTVNATLFSRNTNGGLVFSSGLLTTAGLKTATGTLSLTASNGKTVTVTVGSGLIETWEVASGSSASGGYAVMGQGATTKNIDSITPGIYWVNGYDPPGGTIPDGFTNAHFILIGQGYESGCTNQVAIRTYPSSAIRARMRDRVTDPWHEWK